MASVAARSGQCSPASTQNPPTYDSLTTWLLVRSTACLRTSSRDFCDIGSMAGMLAGPTKVDLLFPAEPHQAEPSWVVSAETLVPIDRHFWDWFLWLTSKEASGKNELVSAELDKMWRHLLRPLGIGEPPSALDKALWSYLEARQAVEAKLGVEVPRRLEREVRKVWPRSS